MKILKVGDHIHACSDTDQKVSNTLFEYIHNPDRPFTSPSWFLPQYPQDKSKQTIIQKEQYNKITLFSCNSKCKNASKCKITPSYL